MATSRNERLLINAIAKSISQRAFNASQSGKDAYGQHIRYNESVTEQIQALELPRALAEKVRNVVINEGRS